MLTKGLSGDIINKLTREGRRADRKVGDNAEKRVENFSKKLKKGIDKLRKMCYDIKAVRSGSEGERKKHLEN